MQTPPAPPSVTLIVTARARIRGRFDDLPENLSDPVLSELIATAEGRGAVWLGGGEPTLRADLPALIAAIRDATGAGVGLHTDGAALQDPGIFARLPGLARLRIPFHSARADAHDWTANAPGALRRAKRAIDAAVAAGLPVEADVVAARPVAPYLAETVAVLGRLGVRAIRIRRVLRRGAAADDFVALSARFGPLSAWLAEAETEAGRAGIALRFVGFPRCVLPSGSSSRCGDEEPVLFPESWGEQPSSPVFRPGCRTCPGGSICAGSPADYEGVFGRTEIEGAAMPEPGVPPAPPASGPTRVAGTARKLGVAPPPDRGERPPAARLAFAQVQAGRELRGDPLRGVPIGDIPPVLEMSWEPDEPTRAIRIRLVRAAQIGAPLLRLSGGVFRHPAAAELIREALRLSFPAVEIVGDCAGIGRLSDREFRWLRGLSRVHADAPDEATRAALDRLAALGVRCG